jgi:phytoene desaturase
MKSRKRIKEDKAVVIGAGLAGLAAAIRLRAKGYQVTLIEASAHPGGKAGELNKNGFRFDTGPSLFTLPELVDELFVLHGKNPREYFSYQSLPYSCKYFYEDGTVIDGHQDAIAFADEVATKTKDTKESVLKFLRYSARIYDLTSNVFIFNSLHRFKTYLTSDAFHAFFNLRKLDTFRTMNKAIRRFFKDEHTIQLFNRYATYNGSNPYKAPATLNVIPHLEHNTGTWFPKGGIYTIPKALESLARHVGVRILYNAPAKAIHTSKGKVVSVEVNDDNLPADVVVSNVDVYKTYRHLLSEEKQPEKLLQQEKSTSAIIFYWGMKARFPDVEVHNILFSTQYEKEFAAMHSGEVSDDPTVYIYVSSKVEAADAPQGQENWFVMINAPHNSGQNWDEYIAEARKNIQDKIQRTLGIAVSDYIVCEEVLDPRGIELNTGSHLGALYGNASNSKYAAFMRHANFSSHIEGLYFCGGSVHPGGGIPLVLASAKIVADLIDEDNK